MGGSHRQWSGRAFLPTIRTVVQPARGRPTRYDDPPPGRSALINPPTLICSRVKSHHSGVPSHAFEHPWTRPDRTTPDTNRVANVSLTANDEGPPIRVSAGQRPYLEPPVGIEPTTYSLRTGEVVRSSWGATGCNQAWDAARSGAMRIRQAPPGAFKRVTNVSIWRSAPAGSHPDHQRSQHLPSADRRPS